MAFEEFRSLQPHGQAELYKAIRRWAQGQSLPGEVKALTGTKGLIELRVKVGTDYFRAIFFKDSPVHDVCVLAVYKNQNKLPNHHKELAMKRMAEWKRAGEK